MHDEQPISLVGTTPAGETTEETVEFDRDGVITRTLVNTHTGQEYALRYYAEVIRDGSRSTVWEPLDRKFIAGNGRDYDFSVRFEFSRGDTLVLRAENIGDHAYHHNMQVGVDYETSIGHRVRDAIRGVM